MDRWRGTSVHREVVCACKMWKRKKPGSGVLIYNDRMD